MGMHQMLGPIGGGASGYEINRSLRFNSGDSSYLNRTPSSAGNRKTWTWSGWVKRCGNNNFETIFSAGGSNTGFRTNITVFFYQDDDATHAARLVVGEGNGAYLRTNARFRDPGAWGHLVIVTNTTLSTAADRIKIYWNGVRITDFSSDTLSSNVPQNSDIGYNTTDRHAIGSQSYNNSLSQYADLYLAEIHFVDGQALSPSSFGEFDDDNNWNPIEADVTYGTNGYYLNFSDNSSNAALGTDSSGNNNTWSVNNTNAFALATGTVSGAGTPANASGTGGWKQAFDGSTSTLVYSSTGNDTTTFTFSNPISWSSKIRIYAGQNGTSGTNIIANGVNLSSSVTWALTGEWKEVTSQLTSPLTSLALTSVGGQSSNIRAVEIDNTVIVQGNAKDIDSVIDSPTNFDADSGNNVGNYATWNPLDKNTNITLSNGNLDAAETSGSNHFAGRCTMKFPSSGKFYYEAQVNTLGGACCIGVDNSGRANPSLANSGVYLILVNSTGNVQRYIGSSYTAFDGQYSTPAVGSILQVAYDADADKLWLGMDNKWMGSGTSANGNPSTGSEATASNVSDPFPSVNLVTSALSVNFGQRPFAFEPPTGYQAICAQNFTDPTVADGSAYFDAKLYTGNGSTQTVSGLNMSPDLVWLKSRSAADNHSFFDSVRGAPKGFHTNLNAAEFNDPSTLTGFTSDGWTMAGHAVTNANNQNYVGWAWDAGSSTASNTDGSITAQVRASTSSGFSIITYTGTGGAATVGHGLNAVPEMIIVKNRNNANSWSMYHVGLGNTKTIALNSDATPPGANSAYWNNTTPTNSVYSVGSSDQMNGGYGNTYAAYAFAPIDGYSAFGSYTGNGSADGVFVYTGFRPAFLLYKRTDSAQPWYIVDTSRDPDNIVLGLLSPNQNVAEDTSTGGVLDLNSNGFKARASFATVNGSGGTYIYAAFAEHPFKTARAR